MRRQRHGHAAGLPHHHSSSSSSSHGQRHSAHAMKAGSTEGEGHGGVSTMEMGVVGTSRPVIVSVASGEGEPVVVPDIMVSPQVSPMPPPVGMHRPGGGASGEVEEDEEVEGVWSSEEEGASGVGKDGRRRASGSGSRRRSSILGHGHGHHGKKRRPSFRGLVGGQHGASSSASSPVPSVLGSSLEVEPVVRGRSNVSFGSASGTGLGNNARLGDGLRVGGRSLGVRGPGQGGSGLTTRDASPARSVRFMDGVGSGFRTPRGEGSGGESGSGSGSGVKTPRGD